jgi:hypothetical protein
MITIQHTKWEQFPPAAWQPERLPHISAVFCIASSDRCFGANFNKFGVIAIDLNDLNGSDRQGFFHGEAFMNDD